MQGADHRMPYDGESFRREISTFFDSRKRRKSKSMVKRKGRCLGGAKVKR